MGGGDTQENAMKVLPMMKFGRWSVIDLPASKYHTMCVCDCGIVKEVDTSTLTRGKSKSCGCLHKEKVTTHGYNGTRTYKSYHAMKERCLNTNHQAYEFYGGRGITICNRWLLSFENFIEDMGERPEGRTLDRINNNEGYSKMNCRWATKSEQNKNKRYGRAYRRTKDT